MGWLVGAVGRVRGGVGVVAVAVCAWWKVVVCVACGGGRVLGGVCVAACEWWRVSGGGGGVCVVAGGGV